MNSNHEINIYVDELIIRTALSNNQIIKKADYVGTVKEFLANIIKPSDVSGSLINFLGPYSVNMLFSTLGFPKFGMLLGVLSSTYNFDFASLLRSIWIDLKPALDVGKVSPSQIGSAVSSAVATHVTPKNQNDDTESNDRSFDQQIRQARMVKLYLTYHQNVPLNKYAAAFTPSLLGKALTWLFTIVLKALGFMVAGDLIKKILPGGSSPSVTTSATTQTKFKPASGTEIKNTGKDVWIENVPNNRSSIENLVIKFAIDVYPGLNNINNSIIKSTEGFKETVDKILFYNRSSSGDNVVFIPNIFTSKRSLVDPFMDEVAQKA